MPAKPFSSSLHQCLFLMLISALPALNSKAQSSIPQPVYDVSAQTRQLSDELLRPQINNSGTVDINLPLYTITCGQLKLPITLNYNTGGIQVSQRPSIVGLGWTLNCGGVITRIVRGNVDEYRPIADVTIPDGTYDETDNTSILTDLSYLGNYRLLNRSDWNTSSFASAIQTTASYSVSGDPNNLDGWPKAADIDLAPDEYDFYLTNGVSGSFWLDHTGKWQVRSNNAVKVVNVQNDGEDVPPPNSATRVILGAPGISQIQLLDEDGNLYTFGQINNNPASVELYRGTTGPPPLVDHRNGVNSPPMAWYLSQVTTPNNDVITLNYKPTFQWSTRLQSNETNLSGTNVAYSGFVNRSLVTTPMIQSITTSQGVTINFTTNPSTQLDDAVPIDDLNQPAPYGCAPSNTYANQCFWGYEDIDGGGPLATMYELDEMQVSYQGSLADDYKFHYTNSTTSRLHLLSFDFLGNGGAGEKRTFQFTYNPTSLPGYNSGMEDLLGYYNGNCFFCNFSGTPTLNDLQTQYLASRAPNSTLMAAESLTGITTPYGGTINYYTEPHDYFNFINSTGYGTSTVASSTIAGGLRVGQIIANANDGNSSPRVTKYHYVQNWISNPSGPSSGVLYDDIGSEALAVDNTGYFQCTHIIGSSRKFGELPLTYSEITEEEPGNGYTVKKFSSYVTGQTDNPPYYMTAASYVGNNLAPYAYDDQKIARGNLKSDQIYNSNHQLLHETDYTYQSDLPGPKNYIRTVQYLKDVANSSGLTIFSFVAFPQYCYNNTLASKTVTEYDNSQNPATTKTTRETFTYDQNYTSKVISENLVDSKGNTRTTAYFYPFSYANGTGSVYDFMVGKNIVGPVIDEQHNITYGNSSTSTPLSQDHNQYQEWFYSTGAFFNPAKKMSTYNGTAVNTSDYSQIDATLVNYDSHQNLLETIARNGIPTSFDYGYNGMYPTVKIVNAANSVQNTITPTIQYQARQLSFPQAGTQTIPFQTDGYSSITVRIDPATTSTVEAVEVTCTIEPVGQVAEICIPSNNPNLPGCNGSAVATIGAGLPAGSYSLLIDPVNNYGETVYVDVSYPTVTNIAASTGIKEFFNENFEESTLSGVATGPAHTGTKYFSGNYNVSFTPPNSRSYTIQWWNLVNGNWQFNEQAYGGPMTLSGTLDDIRVFPSDAQMSTYTYLPLVGIASELDPAGHCTTYQYDNLNRLSLVLDKDKNIIKKICYDYAGQPMSCSGQ